nr:MAG TPA: hypothetical protein [Caudoviricetes sp.]
MDILHVREVSYNQLVLSIMSMSATREFKICQI